MRAEPDPAFELAVFLVASARDALEATPAYGASLLDALARLAPLVPGDTYVHALADRITRTRELMMEDAEAYAAELDALLEDVAAEAKRRNLRRALATRILQ